MTNPEGASQIFPLFPELSDLQREQIENLGPLYAEWNEQINVISRKDFSYFYERHVLHSLCIAKWIDLNEKDVMDVGTGGGFPGLPLAILFPSAKFTLIDSIGKKLKVANDVAERIGLENIRCIHTRIESHEESYDYITGRAVTDLPQLFQWTKKLVRWHKGKGNAGMVYLKGGDFKAELKHIPRKIEIMGLNELIGTTYFETKKLVHIYQ